MKFTGSHYGLAGVAFGVMLGQGNPWLVFTFGVVAGVALSFLVVFTREVGQQLGRLWERILR